MKLLSIFLILSFTINANGQELIELNYLSFVGSLIKNHPAIQSAQLEKANINLGKMAANGAFDPKLNYSNLFKDFNNINYYDMNATQISVPSYIGDFKINYSTAFGQKVNPADYLPSNGVIGMYYSMPLLRGLVTDDRRTELKRQSFSNELGDATYFKKSQALILVASKYYWDWVNFYNNYTLSMDNEQLALTRFENIKSSQKLGEIAPIDTIEAQTQWLIRQSERIKLQYKFNQYSLLLKNFIWDSTIRNTNTIRPANLETSQILANQLVLLNYKTLSNPDITLYQLKINFTKLDAKLKREQLKPKLDAYVGILSTPQNFDFNYQNRATGVAFEFPLFLRKERSGYRVAKNKIEQAKLEYQELNRKIDVDYKSTYLILEGLVIQIKLYEKLEIQYKKLLDAEIEKFNQGESSVFMINSREQKWVDTRQKKVELITDFYYQIALIKYIAGTLLN